MWLSLILLGLLVGITVKQVSQGLFGAMIMTVLTICCAAVAVGNYEVVATNWVAPMWKPDFSLAISMAALFGIPLLLLRLLFDKVIRRACLLPAMVEKVGAGICALITAFTMTGVAALCIQLIPFPNGNIIGFSRVPLMGPPNEDGSPAKPVDPDAPGSELWLSPDRFAAGLVSMLSSGVFSGSVDFYDHHPDLVGGIGWVGATEGEVAKFAPPGSISAKTVTPIEFLYNMTPGEEIRTRGAPVTTSPPKFEPLEAKPGQEFLLASVRLHAEARDQRKSHLFTPRQFRLVGRDGGTRRRQFHAIAIRRDDASTAMTRHIRAVKQGKDFIAVADANYSLSSGNDSAELVFEVPAGFEPEFIEYRRVARASVVRANSDDQGDDQGSGQDTHNESTSSGTATAPTTPATTVANAPPTDGSSDTPPASRRGGRRGSRRRGQAGKANVAGITTKAGQSHFGNKLPMTLTSYRQENNVELSARGMVSGHLSGQVAQQEEGTSPPVSEFDVPQDKRLLHLSSVRLKARSTLGRALSQAVSVVQNYSVEDSNGNRYGLAGKYAVAKVSGTEYVEVQYFRDPVGSIGGVGQFKHIKEKELKATDEFTLLFLVDPGVTIVRFTTGGAASRADDLVSENLIAPN